MGEVVPRAAAADAVGDGVAVAAGSCVGTDERKKGIFISLEIFQHNTDVSQSSFKTV